VCVILRASFTNPILVMQGHGERLLSSQCSILHTHSPCAGEPFAMSYLAGFDHAKKWLLRRLHHANRSKQPHKDVQKIDALADLATGL